MPWIKQKILTHYTKRIIHTNRVVRTNVGFQRAQSVGILYSADNPQKHKVISHLARELKKMGKKVTALCYTTMPIQEVANTFSTITHHDIQLWGAITHHKAQTFINTSFDYLFQADMIGHAVIDYLLARSKAKCRVGYYDTARTSLFEIMVSFDEQPDNNNIDTLTTQMVHYTKLLNV